MRVCIIGNSHLGALKQAMPEFLAEVPDANLMYWGAAGTNFRGIKYEDGMLKSPVPSYSLRVTDGRFTHFRFDDFDWIVIYGAEITPGWAAWKGEQALKGMPPVSRQFSEAIVRDIIDEWWDRQAIAKLLSEVPAQYRRRMVCCAEPFYAESSKMYANLARSVGNLVVAQDAIEGKLGSLGIPFIRQPSKTVAQGLYTAQHHKSGSIGLDTDYTHPDTDIFHMNKSYGLIMLREINSYLRRASEGQLAAAA